MYTIPFNFFNNLYDWGENIIMNSRANITTIIAIIGFLIQLGCIVFYMGKMDARVTTLEIQQTTMQPIIESKLEKDLYYRDRTEVLQQLKDINLKIDKIIDFQLSKKP